MNASVPFYSYRSASGISSSGGVRTHNERAWDTAVHRLPYMLKILRRAGFKHWNDYEQRKFMNDSIWLPIIRSEYRQITGKEALR
jgi:hypothetical protein